MKTQLALAISLVVCTTGCPENKDAPAADKKDDKAKVAVEPKAKDAPAEPAAAGGKYKPNPQVIEMLKKIVAGCTVSVDSPTVYSCKAEEDRALSKYISDSKPKDLYETYASLLDSSDMKMRAAAVAEADNGLFQCDADVLKDNARKEIAQAFLEAFTKNENDYGRQLAQPTVALAFLAGLNDELYKAVEGAKPDTQPRAYIRFLQYGRLDAFPKLQEAAKNKEIARDAMIAPRYMTNWTDAEKAAICPWAKGFIEDADQYTAKEAASTLVECGGEYIDVLLDEGDKRLKAKTLDDPFVSIFNEVCGKYTFQPEAETNKQCKRDYALLEKIVNTKTMKADVRAYALFGIYSQRRNKEVLPVLKKYKKDKTPEIAKKANELIESLAQSGIK